MADEIEVLTPEVLPPAQDPVTKRFIRGNSGGAGKPAGVRNRIQSEMLREFSSYCSDVEVGYSPLVVLAQLSLGVMRGANGVDAPGDVPASVRAAAAGKLAAILLPRLEHVSLRSDGGPLIDQRSVTLNAIGADVNLRRSMERIAHQLATVQLGGDGVGGVGGTQRRLSMPTGLPGSAAAGSQARLESGT